MTDSQALEPSQDVALAYNRAIALADFQAGFLARTSHELRAPLNQIISLHQLILSDLCDSPEEERTFLAQAQAATQKVLKNLDLLISVSNLVVGRVKPDLQPVQVASFLQQVEQFIALQAANRSCRMEIVSPETDLYVYGDPYWLQQALVMLVEGAIAHESQQIRLQSQQTSETIQIWITYDGALEGWRATSLTEMPQTEPSTEKAELPLAFSLQSRLQLASQILAAMTGEISLRPPTAKDNPIEGSTHLILSLPNAAEKV